MIEPSGRRLREKTRGPRIGPCGVPEDKGALEEDGGLGKTRSSSRRRTVSAEERQKDGVMEVRGRRPSTDVILCF